MTEGLSSGDRAVEVSFDDFYRSEYAPVVRLLARLGQEHPDEPRIGVPSAELWAMVRELPRRRAQVVALAFLEDRSIRDIADILGCGEESVRTHLRRGREALGRRLDEGSGDG